MPDAAQKRFPQDRALFFDLKQTDALFKLAKVPTAERSPTWTEAFMAAVWCASLEVGRVFHGPDTFPYLRMHLPRPGVAFDSNSLGNVARGVLEEGFGVAVFASPEAQDPIWVFAMGQLSSMVTYDTWLGDPVDLEELQRGPAMVKNEHPYIQSLEMRGGEKMLVGSPATAFLPPHTARALHRHLADGWKIPEPRVSLMVYAGGTPSRNLVINRKMSAFPDEKTAARQANMLLWYLPPKRSLVLMPESWREEQMTPLVDLFPVRPKL